MSHSPPLVETRLSGMVLVCGDCEERSDGLTKLKAKQVHKELKRDLVHLPGRMWWRLSDAKGRARDSVAPKPVRERPIRQMPGSIRTYAGP